jgi:hypothetical protein
MPERSKAEREFIDQRTRQLMVRWCDYAVRGDGTIPDLLSLTPSSDASLLKVCKSLEMGRVYYEHAIAKKWLAAKSVDGSRKILSAGWTTAKSFLKR